MLTEQAKDTVIKILLTALIFTTMIIGIMYHDSYKPIYSSIIPYHGLEIHISVYDTSDEKQFISLLIQYIKQIKEFIKKAGIDKCPF